MAVNVLAVAAVAAGLTASNSARWRHIQYGSGPDLAVGNLLVASAETTDPNFYHSVVLIVRYDDAEGAVGVILNRRTDVPLSEAFPAIRGARADPVYLGGPVETETGQALIRAQSKPDGANSVIGDVYVTGDKDAIEKAVRSGAPPTRFRVFLGYGGWAPDQLEQEIELGGWHVMRGTTAIAFDDEPDSLWSRLERSTRRRIATLFRSPAMKS